MHQPTTLNQVQYLAKTGLYKNTYSKCHSYHLKCDIILHLADKMNHFRVHGITTMQNIRKFFNKERNTFMKKNLGNIFRSTNDRVYIVRMELITLSILGMVFLITK